VATIPVLSKTEIAQYVFQPPSYTYTSVLSKSFSYKTLGTSSIEEFLSAARPAWAVVPAPLDSPHGHPHPEVLARLRAHGTRVLTTGQRGTVTVSTDGEDLRVETFMKP